jgi:hypothetical protein
MDAEAVRWALTGLMGLIMWFWKRNMDEVDKEMALLKVDLQHLRDTRVHKDDLREFKHELRMQFDEVKAAIKDLKHGNQ